MAEKLSKKYNFQHLNNVSMDTNNDCILNESYLDNINQDNLKSKSNHINTKMEYIIYCIISIFNYFQYMKHILKNIININLLFNNNHRGIARGMYY